jgi:hypothetical protein
MNYAKPIWVLSQPFWDIQTLASSVVLFFKFISASCTCATAFSFASSETTHDVRAATKMEKILEERTNESNCNVSRPTRSPLSGYNYDLSE